MRKSTYLLDDRLVPRIKQILRTCNGRANVSYLTEELQTQYGEYARKKKNALVKSVEKGLAIAIKDLQKEGIQISTNGSSSSDSEADFEADQHRDKNIMNSMINRMYKQGQPTTPTSGNKVINSAHSTSVFTDSHKNSSELSGAQAESDAFKGRESLRWCIDRRSNTSTTAEKMEPDVSHNNSMHIPTGNNHVGPVDGDGVNDKNVGNLDSAKNGRPKKRRRESPDGLKRKKHKPPVYPDVTFSNVGGNESTLQHLKENCYFLEYPEFLQIMKDLPRSFLFHGPTGCGKTLLANSVAGQYKVPLLSVTATELVGGISGDSEANIRDLFNQAAELAPCVLLIDDVDAIAGKRETATKGMESRVVTQLSSSMDELKSKNLPVLMICATNRPNSLDEAFRRTGRFDIEFAMRYPNKDARHSILQTVCQGVPLAEDVSLSTIATLTPGYVGSDLKVLITITNACALHRAITEYKMQKQNNVMNGEKIGEGSLMQDIKLTREDIPKIPIMCTMADFQKAMTTVKPTAKQEDVILIPNTTWEDIGGLDNIRHQVNLCVMERLNRPQLYIAADCTSSLGVLLVGPPGCGKTSVAKAVANEAGINFLYVKGPELFNKYLGESEKNLRDVFAKANSLAPCVIFFDEIDSLCPRRSSGSSQGSENRVTATLLAEMSGFQQRNEVYVIAATNNLDCLDPALLRPGRMDKVIYVGLPRPEERVEILKALTKNGMRPKLADDVNLDCIGKDKRCNGFSGADMWNLLQVAKETCLEHIIATTDASQPFEMPVLYNAHFETAFKSVRASVNSADKKNYEAVKRLLESKTVGDMAGINVDSNPDAF